MQKIKVLQVYKIFNPSGGGVERHIDGITKTIDNGFKISYIAKDIIDTSNLNTTINVLKSNIRNNIKEIKNNDIIHIHGARFVFNLSFFLLSKIYKKKIIYTPHCYYDGKTFLNKVIKYIWDNTFEKFIYLISDHVILLNDFWLDFAIKKKFKSSKISIIPNCVISKNYSYIDHSGKKKSDQLNILSLCRIDKVKRIEDVIELIKNKDKVYKFHIVGDGPELENLKKKYSKFKNLIFYGFIDDKKLEEILKNIDIFIISSEKEGMPTTVIEMVLRNIPVIATNIPGNLAILGSYNDKFNYDVGNLEKLKEILERKNFVIDKSLYENVKKNFTWENQIKEIQKLYYE